MFNLQEFISNQKPLDPEIKKLLNDNFWYLLNVTGSSDLIDDGQTESIRNYV